jgi:putative (di)nucleoside polyphosphate hydrolase
MTVDPKNLPYRRGVGLCLFNNQGLVLVAERRDKPGAWQMPQGGVNRDEDLQVTALRELKEEVGTDKAEIIARLPEKLYYEFPDWLQYRGGIFRGKYRGQEQDWFALRFLGQDSDIDLSGEHEPENPEFINWRWAELAETPKLIVDFKRPVYEAMVAGFMPLMEAIKRGEKLPVWAK